MRTILIVDDEPNVLEGLKRSLRPMRKQWSITLESNPEAAMQLLEAESFDVVISDMLMPKINGIQVLNHCREHCPDAIRFGLSGFANSQMSYEAACVVHQYFAKPCGVNDLVAAINRVIRLREKLNCPELIEFVHGIDALPTLPDLYTKITEEAGAPDGSLERVGEMISKDPAMTAKILQLVNSAHFGIAREVCSVPQAASLLGFDTLRALVLNISLFSTFKDGGDTEHLDYLWRHSTQVADLATQVAQALKLSKQQIGQATLAGFLHDVGQLIFMVHNTRAHKVINTMVGTGMIQRHQAEHDLLSYNHTDIGAYLLDLWGLPAPVVQAVAFHHTPSLAEDTNVGPLTAVFIAHELLLETAPGTDLITDPIDNSDYLRSVCVPAELVHTFRNERLQQFTSEEKPG